MNYAICVCRGNMVNILSIFIKYIFRLSARNSWTIKRLREGLLKENDTMAYNDKLRYIKKNTLASSLRVSIDVDPG